MFFLNWMILISVFMNLCNVGSVVWFLDDRKPLLDTSKQLTFSKIHSKLRVPVAF